METLLSLTRQQLIAALFVIVGELFCTVQWGWKHLPSCHIRTVQVTEEKKDQQPPITTIHVITRFYPLHNSDQVNIRLLVIHEQYILKIPSRPLVNLHRQPLYTLSTVTPHPNRSNQETSTPDSSSRVETVTLIPRATRESAKQV